jgi:hypothetical protein
VCSKREHRTHSGTRVARSVRRLVAGCAAGCGCLDSARCAAGCSIRHLADSAADAADLNAHPLSPRQEDLEVRRSVSSLRSICSGLAPSADHDSEVAIHAACFVEAHLSKPKAVRKHTAHSPSTGRGRRARRPPVPCQPASQQRPRRSLPTTHEPPLSMFSRR